METRRLRPMASAASVSPFFIARSVEALAFLKSTVMRTSPGMELRDLGFTPVWQSVRVARAGRAGARSRALSPAPLRGGPGERVLAADRDVIPALAERALHDA